MMQGFTLSGHCATIGVSGTQRRNLLDATSLGHHAGGMSENDAGAHGSSPSRGRRIAMPRSRRYVNDFLYFCHRVPTQAIYRDCNVGRLAALRRRADPRIGWSAIMLRAYALMAARRPWLQRCFMKWPWEHLYEHPAQVCRFTVAREVDGEERVLFCAN